MSLLPQMLPREPDLLCQKLKRFVLRHAGFIGSRQLSLALHADVNNPFYSEPLQSFLEILANFGCELKEKEINLLKVQFDADGNDTICVLPFLAIFRTGIPCRRKFWILKAWSSIPKVYGGDATLRDVISMYNVAAHPDVSSSKFSLQELEQKFSSDFDASLYPSEIVTREDFEMYYAGVSAFDDCDEHFGLMMCNCWSLPHGSGNSSSCEVTMNGNGGYNTSSSSSSFKNDSFLRTLNTAATQSSLCFSDGQQKLHLERTISDNRTSTSAKNRIDKVTKICVKVKNFVTQQSSGFSGVGAVFHSVDSAGSGYIPQQYFQNVVTSLKLPIIPSEFDVLFEEFDTNGDGATFNYEEFMFSICGDLPPRRVAALEAVWRSLSPNNDGKIDSQFLCERFQVSKNPLVAKSIWTQNKVREDFMMAFGHQGMRGNLTFKDFQEYFYHISALIQVDSHFDIMMKNMFA